MMIQLATKRVKLDMSENEDRLSDLPESVILHIMSFLDTGNAVRTCILSKRWKDRWKLLPALIMLDYEFRSLKIFNKFVSKVFSLRDSSIALQSLDFRHTGFVRLSLLKKIVNYVSSHNVQGLALEVKCDIEQIRHSIFSCQTLTFLDLCVHPRNSIEEKPLFPTFISLPALTTLRLWNFAFCASENNAYAEPFSALNKLRTLVLHQCGVRDTLTLCISSATLVNLRVHCYTYLFYEIELLTPNLGTFAFVGKPNLKVYGSSLSYVKHVEIDALIQSKEMEPPRVLLNWLLELANTKSLTVTASTLQVLSLNSNLSETKLPSLGNLKYLIVKREKIHNAFLKVLIEDKLQKIKSRKEAAKLRKSFKAGLESSAPIPDGVVEFLMQNSPSAEVDIVDCC